jgi:hypothetical protein
MKPLIAIQIESMQSFQSLASAEPHFSRQTIIAQQFFSKAGTMMLFEPDCLLPSAAVGYSSMTSYPTGRGSLFHMELI